MSAVTRSVACQVTLQSKKLADSVAVPMHRRGNYPDIVNSENAISVSTLPSRQACQQISQVALSSQSSQQCSLSASPGSIHTMPSNPAAAMPRNTRRSAARATTTSSNQRLSSSGNGEVSVSHRDNLRILGRRQQQRDVDLVTSNHPPAHSHQIRTQDLNTGVMHFDSPPSNGILPDILNSHMVSRPMVISRPNQHRHPRNSNRQGRSRTADRSTHRQRSSLNTSRHSARTRTTSASSFHQEQNCKEPCLKCLTAVTSFKWVLVILSLLGVCCVVTGIVLAAIPGISATYLFLAIMFIGLGVLLVIVVGIGWKCTPRGHEPLHLLFGLGDHRLHHVRPQRRLHRNREGNWHGGVMYPEFQYRRPPPSYDASMQEYQNQLMQQYNLQNPSGDNYSLPSSPPPTYRSRASTVRHGVHIVFPPNQSDPYPNSLPPTYRSQAGIAGVHLRPSLPRNSEENDSSRANTVDVATNTTNTQDSGTQSVLLPESSVPNTDGSPVTAVSISETSSSACNPQVGTDTDQSAVVTSNTLDDQVTISAEPEQVRERDAATTRCSNITAETAL